MDEDATITGSTKLPLSLQRGIRPMSEQIWSIFVFSVSPQGQLFCHVSIVLFVDIIQQGAHAFLQHGDLVIEGRHILDIYHYVQSDRRDGSLRKLYEIWSSFKKDELPLFQCSPEQTGEFADVVHVDAIAVLLGAFSVDISASDWDDFKHDITIRLQNTNMSQEEVHESMKKSDEPEQSHQPQPHQVS